MWEKRKLSIKKNKEKLAYVIKNEDMRFSSGMQGQFNIKAILTTYHMIMQTDSQQSI